jgi:hypothetical protein
VIRPRTPPRNGQNARNRPAPAAHDQLAGVVHQLFQLPKGRTHLADVEFFHGQLPNVLQI